MDKKRFQNVFFDQVVDLKTILDVLDRIPGSLFMIKNLESRYVYMSSELRSAIHLDAGYDVVGKTDFDLFPKIVAETFRQNDLLVFREGRSLLNEIHATALFSGPTRWFFSSKYPLHNQRGEIIGLITINHPYDQKRSEDSELNQLLPAIEYMTKNFEEKITIAELAALCILSESHFMRIFKQRIKMTAYAFLEQVRMYHAIDAIKQSSDSIAAIAHRCGFYDHSSFIKRFKKTTGTTPLKFRQNFLARQTPDLPIVLPELTEQ